MTQNTKPPVLKLERTFRATPERLWAYWTEPEKYAKWLNPSGIDLVIHEWDARPGGRIRFDMPQPDGNKNPQEGVFHVMKPFTEIVSGDADKTFLLTVRFEPVDAKRTRVVVLAEGVPLDWHVPATQGWGLSFAHLEREMLVSAPPAAPEDGFTIVREFKAAPEKVWEMWTTKEGLMSWWALSAADMGYEFSVNEIEVRLGGRFAFQMRNKDVTLVNAGTYTRVAPHTELAWSWHFDIFLKPEEKPYDVPIVVQLERLGNGGTRMRFTQGPLASREHTEGSRQGVTANLEKLTAALGE